jgi:hypothetical protein
MSKPTPCVAGASRTAAQAAGLAEAGRGSGQPEACPAAERGVRSAGWPKAERDDSFRHRRGS